MNQLRIEAAIIVQGYLLEILLGTTVRSQANPLQMLENIRFQVKTQLAEDHKFQQPIPPELARAIDDALSAALGRVSEQLTNSPPQRHNA